MTWVIDLGLPDQSGKILVEYTRQNTASGIVVVTAQDRVEVRIDAFQAGADLFFSKPVDLRELTAAIGNLVLRKQEKQEAVLPLNLVLRCFRWVEGEKGR